MTSTRAEPGEGIAARTCAVCGNSAGNRTHVAREMMFGWRDPFEYLECGGCGCLQLVAVPADLQRYYPDTYYSFAARGEKTVGRLVRGLRHACARGLLRRRVRLLEKILGRAGGVPDAYGWLRRAGAGFDSDILDLGSGSGELLTALRDDGFRRLTGIDPYIDPARTVPGIALRCCSIAEIERQHDFVILNHSFEHMPEPRSVLRHLRRIVRPGSTILIRVPVVPSFAWRTYGVDWVQLDAPRHLFLHSRESLRLLAEQVGLRIVHVEYDSSAFQLWGSEQYRRAIPLRDPRSYAENPSASMFRRAEIEAFRSRARELNAAQDGDSASFYLQGV